MLIWVSSSVTSYGDVGPECRSPSFCSPGESCPSRIRVYAGPFPSPLRVGAFPLLGPHRPCPSYPEAALWAFQCEGGLRGVIVCTSTALSEPLYSRQPLKRDLVSCLDPMDSSQFSTRLLASLVCQNSRVLLWIVFPTRFGRGMPPPVTEEP